MLQSQLDKFRVRSIAGGVQVSVEVAAGRPGSPRPVVRGLTRAEAQELARRLNAAAADASAWETDINPLPGLTPAFIQRH